MDRRTFLRLLAPGTVAHTETRRRHVIPGSALPLEEGDGHVLRDIAQGRCRVIGRLPPTDEVVLSMDPARSRESLLRFSTIADYSDPELIGNENPRGLSASVRQPTISIIIIIGPTPYRMTLMPCDDFTAFIAFVNPVSLRVYLRRYACVDTVALVEERVWRRGLS